MKKYYVTVLAIMAFSISGVFAKDHIGQKAVSEIINNKGEVIGNAHYIQGNRGVVFEIELSGLPAGKHGMHFHKKGTCEDIQKFKMAKGHIMPSNRPSGYLNPKGPHEGNLPNLIVNKDGSAHVELYTGMVSINGHDGKPALLDEDGSVLMIHVNKDDYTTQPIGGAGARIACGVIKKDNH